MIKLRALTIEDASKTLKWHNKQEISDLYSGHPFPVNREMEDLWYDKILTSNFPTTVFGIEHVSDKKLIGITILKNINMINRNSEIALYIGDDDYLGKGLSKEAVNETLKFGFARLNLERIYLKVLENNVKAIQLYEKLGFTKEGKMRKSIFKNNTYLSEYFYSILKNEYNEKL